MNAINETKIDWQFINDEDLFDELLIEVDQIAGKKYWNDKGIENFTNAGLVSKKETRKQSLGL